MTTVARRRQGRVAVATVFTSFTWMRRDVCRRRGFNFLFLGIQAHAPARVAKHSLELQFGACQVDERLEEAAIRSSARLGGCTYQCCNIVVDPLASCGCVDVDAGIWLPAFLACNTKLGLAPARAISRGISASPLKDDIMNWTAVMFGPVGRPECEAKFSEASGESRSLGLWLHSCNVEMRFGQVRKSFASFPELQREFRKAVIQLCPRNHMAGEKNGHPKWNPGQWNPGKWNPGQPRSDSWFHFGSYEDDTPWEGGTFQLEASELPVAGRGWRSGRTSPVWPMVAIWAMPCTRELMGRNTSVGRTD